MSALPNWHALSVLPYLSQDASSPLEQFYRQAPWIFMVLIGISAGWTAEQVFALVLLVFGISVVGGRPPAAAAVA